MSRQTYCVPWNAGLGHRRGNQGSVRCGIGLTSRDGWGLPDGSPIAHRHAPRFRPTVVARLAIQSGEASWVSYWSITTSACDLCASWDLGSLEHDASILGMWSIGAVRRNARAFRVLREGMLSITLDN